MDHEVADLAQDWLDLAGRIGWGVEGPIGHAPFWDTLTLLATGGEPSRDALRQLKVLANARPPRGRPVDALFEVGALVADAVLEGEADRRSANLSAARGWLTIASR